jgi:AbrB family looped-hinge helix DNA binding protein
VQIKLSTKGQIVLPITVRTELRLKPGEPLEVAVEGERIVLTPRKRVKRKGRIVKDPVTGMPVLTFGPGAPIITSEMVNKLLEDFP